MFELFLSARFVERIYANDTTGGGVTSSQNRWRWERGAQCYHKDNGKTLKMISITKQAVFLKRSTAAPLVQPQVSHHHCRNSELKYVTRVLLRRYLFAYTFDNAGHPPAGCKRLSLLTSLALVHRQLVVY